MNRPFNKLELEVEKGEGRSSHKPRESQLRTRRHANSSERPWENESVREVMMLSSKVMVVVVVMVGAEEQRARGRLADKS